MERTEAMTAAAAPDRALDRPYVDWAAVLAGAAVAAAIGLLFASFGAALGLSSVSAEPGEGSGLFALILSGLWMVVTLVASFMTGGYVAGRMRRRVDQASAEEVATRDGINGLVVWAVGTIAGAMILASVVAGTVSAVGSATSAVGSAAGSVIEASGAAVGGLAQGAGAAAAGLLPDGMAADPLEFVGASLLRPAAVDPGTADPAAVAAQTAAILGNVLATGEISDADRGYLVSATTAQTGLSLTEAEARVDQAIAAAEDARRAAEETRAAAEAAVQEAQDRIVAAAETARVSAILTAFVLTAAALVAAAAATSGAVRGGRHRDEGRIFAGLAYRL
jgi:hypothetical protein